MLIAPKQQLETFLFATQGKRRSLGLVWLMLIMCLAPFFAFLASPFPYPWLYLTVSPTLAVFLAVQVIWGYQWTGWLWLCLMRLLMGLALAFMFFTVCLTGGINSPQLIWLASVPLVALFMMGQRATLVLTGLVMLLMVLVGWATSAGLLPDQITFLPAHVGWAVGNHVAATLVLCAVPLLYHLLYSSQLLAVKNSNLVLEKARQELVQAEAYKDEFVAGVGHELRTPMFAILGLNDVLRHELKSDPRALATVDVIRTSTDRLLQLTNHILDYSQLRAEQLRLHAQPVNLPALLQDCLQEFQPRAQGQVRLVADLAPDLPDWLWADRQRLREVLCHLLDNAFKFTASGEVCLQVQRQSDWLTFGVQDTGVGVPLAQQQFIFNRFEHADEETHRQFGGAGLGLSICEQLVRLFGGKMTLLSQPGKGACFRFSIPLQLCDAPVAGPEVATRSDPWRILLVDDDALSRQVTELFCLRLWPAAVVSSAHSGPEGLALLRMQAFDVVMMDAFMPGMDGAEVTGLIRSSLPAPACQVPVIGLTASSHPQDRAACLAAGMNDVLCKPLDQASLLACVQQLGQPRGGPPPATGAAPGARQAWPEALRTHLDQVTVRLLGNRQRRFFWAYSLAIVLLPFAFSFLGLPKGPDGTLLISIGLVYALLLLAIAAGMPTAWSVHLGSTYAAFVLLHDATLAGGIFSPSIGWLIIFPLGALIIIGKRAFLLWLLVVLVCFVGMAAATWLGYVPALYHATPANGWWSLTNYMAITLMMVLLPLLYADLYNKALSKSRQRHTELLDKQAELLRAQEQKNRFIAALSHEMRTPMNAILGFNDLLQLHAPTPRVQALVSQVRQSGDHLLTLINDILDYSQIQTGQIVARCEAFTLADTVRNAFELFAPRVASMKIDYRLDMADDLPAAVLGDRHRLMQILVNLLGNAIKFTHQGSVTLAVQRDGQALLFAVQDTGIGIEASRQASIFERFAQATPQTASLYGGNGLGLAICRQLVQLLGGNIGVDSELGRGSRFWFRLTMPDAPVAAAPVAVPLPTAPLQTQAPLRVLVVDDSPINLMLASAVVLARWPDARVKEAEHGLQALDLLRAQPFDLVLMDMVMPVMDGIAATEVLRTQLPAPTCQTPVIGLTANVNEQDHARGLQAGMNAIVLKPFDRRQLYAQILAQLAAAAPVAPALAADPVA
jgi:signal transduction histidine kinase/DNA-binding response OmpR family regulator